MKRFQILILLLLPVMAMAAGETGMASLKIGASARSSAMGEAFTAISDDASGIFWNPAGSAWATTRQAGFTYNQWLQDINHNTAGVIFPTSKGTIGLGLLLNSVDGFERRTIASEEPLGTFSIQDFSLSMSYARKLSNKLSVGVSARYLYEKIYIETSSGYAIDLGARYQLYDGLFAGAAVQNLGSMSEMVNTQIALPTIMRGGLAWYLPFAKQNLLLALDFVSYKDQDSHLHAGVEYNPFSIIVLRGGYQTGYEEKSLSAGFGVKAGIFTLDYAYVPFQNDLGNSQRFSVFFQF